MTISTAIGLFIIPVCYVFVQKLVERGGKKAPQPVKAPVAPTAPDQKGGAH
jgi:hypothetical protein